jgi:y4mF family transcriptional regulator
MAHNTEELIEFVKNKRSDLGLTQEELAKRAGVGLRFVRDLEQGKETVQINKVNQILVLFGYKVGPVKIRNRDEL